MQNIKHTLVLYAVLSQIILFIWYYLTLPGSVIPPKSISIIKPTMTAALLKFLTFMLPFYIYIAWVIYNHRTILQQVNFQNLAALSA